VDSSGDYGSTSAWNKTGSLRNKKAKPQTKIVMLPGDDLVASIAHPSKDRKVDIAASRLPFGSVPQNTPSNFIQGERDCVQSLPGMID
jgi:hypothetical protein